MFKLLSKNWLGSGLAALVMIAVGGPSPAAEIKWNSHTSTEGRFTAKFPGEVKVEKKPNATHVHASPADMDADFRVAYTDRPKADANLEAAFKELARIRVGTCKSQQVEAEDILDYLHDGRPACRFSFTKEIGSTKAYYQMVFIMDGNRFYQVLYGYAIDAPMKKEGEFFANSFKINQ
jgi:hypothetical protein